MNHFFDGVRADDGNIRGNSRACWKPVLMRLYSLLLHSQALSCLSLWQASRERPSLWAWAARSAARRSASTTRELRWASRLSTLTTATQDTHGHDQGSFRPGGTDLSSKESRLNLFTTQICICGGVLLHSRRGAVLYLKLFGRRGTSDL